MPRRTRSKILGKRAQWEQDQRVQALKELRRILRRQRPKPKTDRDEQPNGDGGQPS